MEKDVLSLKSLYRFLVNNDYPVYSTGIITEENRKGLTLVKFWQENILYEFKSRKYGRMIWRMTGSRNRYLSEICNRSERLRFYREYAWEIANSGDIQTCLSQTVKFMDFLVSHQFSYEVFVKKLSALLECYRETDACFTEEVAAFFWQEKEQMGEMEKRGVREQAFCCGWFLTFLSLHAMAGDRMADVELAQFRNDVGLRIKALWELYRKRNEVRRAEVNFLTQKNSELCTAPLPEKHFFGREVELFELRELCRKGGRYLLSGIGGAGKTELLKQLLRDCCEEHLVDTVCTIQYTGSLKDSFVRAFPGISGKDIENNFKEAMGIIRSHGKERILLLIDNVNHTMEEDDSLRQLLRLPGTIFITSRNPAMEGFMTYEVKAPSKEAGMLIFRDNYGRILTEEDRQCLDEIFRQELWCHVLTLQLLGKASKAKNWSVRELREHLEKGDKGFSWEEDGGKVSLRQIYHRMYSLSKARLHRSQIRLLRTFAVWPYDSYSLGFAAYFLEDFLEAGEDMEKELEGLRQLGFLERREEGYSMHPFVAECMVSRSRGEAEYAGFFRRVQEAWRKELHRTADEGEEMWTTVIRMQGEGENAVRLAGMILAMTERIKGSACREFLHQALVAGAILANRYGYSEQTQRILRKLLKGSKAAGDELWIYLYSLECQYDLGDMEALDEVIRRQEERRTVPEYLYMEFCWCLSRRMVKAGMPERAETLAKSVLAAAGSRPEQKLQACLNMVYVERTRGDTEAMDLWLDKGLKIAGREGGIQEEALLEIWYTKSVIYASRGMKEKAEAAMAHLDKLAGKPGNLRLGIEMNLTRGIVETYIGNPEKAIPYMEKSLELGSYFYGADSMDYAVSSAELAMAQNRAGRREDALVNYKAALQIIRVQPECAFDLLRVLNNMAVVYLDWEKPEEALELLGEAYGLGKKLGGISLAEPANNLSKAWRMLKDRSRELGYLEEAYPLLKQIYGEEHPKVVDAGKRMKE